MHARSGDQYERLGGVLAIDELIDVKVPAPCRRHPLSARCRAGVVTARLHAQLLGEDAAKTSHFAAYLCEVFQPGTEPLTMEVAAATLGHLVRSGGALTADIVEVEVRAHGRPRRQLPCG